MAEEVIRNVSASAAAPAGVLVEGSWGEETTVAGLPCTPACDAHAPVVEGRDMVHRPGACRGPYVAGSAGCTYQAVAYRHSR